MKIDVEPYGWGEAIPGNIAVLLTDVSSHLNRLLAEPVADHINVVHVSGASAVPRTLYRYSEYGPITIRLTARDHLWSKFAYQFSHEFCHVLSNYERLGDGPNNWFHEALCELASVFTLRRMAERWPILPPYPNWADYASALYDYADDLLENENHQLPKGLTLANWLTMHEEEIHGWTSREKWGPAEIRTFATKTRLSRTGCCRCLNRTPTDGTPCGVFLIPTGLCWNTWQTGKNGQNPETNHLCNA